MSDKVTKRIATVAIIVAVVFGSIIILKSVNKWLWDEPCCSYTTSEIEEESVVVPVVAEPEPEPEQESVELIFVGDIMLSRAIGRIMGRENDWKYHFAHVNDIIREADISFGNLESAISSRGKNVGSIYSFRADPRSVEGLVDAGFDVLSFANNHVWDYGKEAFDDTFVHLAYAGIDIVGAGADSVGARTPVIIERGGVRFAYLAYTDLLPQFLLSSDARPAVAMMSVENIKEDVSRIRTESLADVVIVSLHWGEEYEIVQNSFQTDLSHAVIDAGANLVIGHHPHVIQPTEKYKDGYIAYSLGNFVFDQNFSPETREGLMLKVVMKGSVVESFDTLKVQFTDTFQPYVAGQ